MALIQKTSLDFLKALSRNNNRDWFQKNKERYMSAHQNALEWVDELIAAMNQHDQIETNSAKESLYRIYNDVRFSADKIPFDPRFAGYLRRSKPLLRGGYYFWIKPGASRVGCGFTYPSPNDMKRIRLDIALNFGDWKKLLRSKTIVKTFGSMQGEQVKTAPRGFAKNDPAIELLRFKQFWFEKSFTDHQVLASNFAKEVNHTFKAIRPFFDYMSDILSTNSNGETLY